MTIGSTASLPGFGPEAPFHPFHTFRDDKHLPVLPRLRPASAAQRQVPRTALADDPPRGRILVVTNQASLALDVTRILRDAGYRAIGPAASADEVKRLNDRCPIDGALLDLQLEGGGASIVADRLADIGIPFVWLTDALLDAIPRKHAFAPAVTKPFEGKDLIGALERTLS